MDHINFLGIVFIIILLVGVLGQILFKIKKNSQNHSSSNDVNETPSISVSPTLTLHNCILKPEMKYEIIFGTQYLDVRDKLETENKKIIDSVVFQIMVVIHNLEKKPIYNTKLNFSHPQSSPLTSIHDSPGGGINFTKIHNKNDGVNSQVLPEVEYLETDKDKTLSYYFEKITASGVNGASEFLHLNGETKRSFDSDAKTINGISFKIPVTVIQSYPMELTLELENQEKQQVSMGIQARKVHSMEELILTVFEDYIDRSKDGELDNTRIILIYPEIKLRYDIEEFNLWDSNVNTENVRLLQFENKKWELWDPIKNEELPISEIKRILKRKNYSSKGRAKSLEAFYDKTTLEKKEILMLCGYLIMSNQLEEALKKLMISDFEEFSNEIGILYREYKSLMKKNRLGLEYPREHRSNMNLLTKRLFDLIDQMENNLN